MHASVCVYARVFVCMCVHVRVYVRVYIAQTHMVIKICGQHHCTIITWYHETVSIRSSSLEGLINLWSLSWQEIVITGPYVSVDHDIIVVVSLSCNIIAVRCRRSASSSLHRHRGIVIKEHCNGRVG